MSDNIDYQKIEEQVMKESRFGKDDLLFIFVVTVVVATIGALIPLGHAILSWSFDQLGSDMLAGLIFGGIIGAFAGIALWKGGIINSAVAKFMTQWGKRYHLVYVGDKVASVPTDIPYTPLIRPSSDLGFIGQTDGHQMEISQVTSYKYKDTSLLNEVSLKYHMVFNLKIDLPITRLEIFPRRGIAKTAIDTLELRQAVELESEEFNKRYTLVVDKSQNISVIWQIFGPESQLFLIDHNADIFYESGAFWFIKEGTYSEEDMSPLINWLQELHPITDMLLEATSDIAPRDASLGAVGPPPMQAVRQITPLSAIKNVATTIGVVVFLFLVACACLLSRLPTDRS